MTAAEWGEVALVALSLGLLVRPLGLYLARVYADQPTPLRPLLRPVERSLYWLAGVDPSEEQIWSAYARSLLLFNLVGVLALYVLLRLQALLPGNVPGLSADLAFNTAISFATNTSWQSYVGETSLAPIAQMAGIAVQSFLSAAVGLAVAVALIRGLAARGSGTIGNFAADLVRGTLYVLLPLAFVTALFFVWQGLPQSFHPAVPVHTIQGGTQTLALGPVASEEAIKLPSGDGGGYFNANSAHPFENPTPLTNAVQIILMLSLGSALTVTFGRIVGNERQGWAVLGTMVLLFGLGFAALQAIEPTGNPAFAPLGVDQSAGAFQPGGNMEGKEVRFGMVGATLFAETSTASSDGAVNGMHDSFLPLSGIILLGNMMLDEVIIGAPGAGLWGILLFCLVAVFISGLMIGRTPEFLGKKIEAREIKMVVLALLVAPAGLLGLTALACVTGPGLAGPANAGPHGFSEILYAYTSAAATNGSAFAGLNATTPFYNVTLALAMMAGRYAVIVPVLAIAGSLSAKRAAPRSGGALPTDGLLFVLLLAATIVILGGLSFFPALALGPIVEHFALMAGQGY